MSQEKKYKSGFVSIIGRPNVGKSTLMNCLIGEKIAITSHKPQTTRNKIQTILTRNGFQCIFIDTPGLHTPKSKLGKFMVKSAESSLSEMDIVMYLVEPYEKINENDLNILEKLQKVTSNVFLVINKIDTVNHDKILEVISVYKNKYDFAEIIPISAINAKKTDLLMETIKKYLPEGPQYYPEDMVTDQVEKQIVSEIIREKTLKLLNDEIPHGIAVSIISMKVRKNRNIYDIEATIFCERESHKGIVIGKKGSKLRDIGTRSRFDIERLLGCDVNLQLWVKVKKGWRDSDFLLKDFGYNGKEI